MKLNPDQIALVNGTILLLNQYGKNTKACDELNAFHTHLQNSFLGQNKEISKHLMLLNNACSAKDYPSVGEHMGHLFPLLTKLLG